MWALELCALGSRPGSHALSLCGLGQVACSLWAPPFIFTLRPFHLAIPRAWQFYWPHGASFKSEAS